MEYTIHFAILPFREPKYVDKIQIYEWTLLIEFDTQKKTGDDTYNLRKRLCKIEKCAFHCIHSFPKTHANHLETVRDDVSGIHA